jgi:flavin reductase (DIM6/NTAB) family NADH-FMN oxidoreductase RutF
MQFTENDFLSMEQRYRASFFNSLGGFKSLVLIGTTNTQKQTNLAVFNSLMHLGANPPLCSILVRPASVERHTYENILETKWFTVNHVNESFYKQAHQTSARYLRHQSEFNEVGLTEEYSSLSIAPYVTESPIKFACELVQVVEIELNKTLLVIGKIKEVVMQGDYVLEDGFVDIEKAGSMTVSGLDSYHKTNRIARLSYAKTDSPLKEI